MAPFPIAPLFPLVHSFVIAILPALLLQIPAIRLVFLVVPCVIVVAALVVVPAIAIAVAVPLAVMLIVIIGSDRHRHAQRNTQQNQAYATTHSFLLLGLVATGCPFGQP